MEEAVAEAERSAERLRAAAAAAATSDEPGTYRVRRDDDSATTGVTIRDGERKLHIAPGRTSVPAPAPIAAPAAPVAAEVPAATSAAEDPALAQPPAEYVSPKAEQAAAWVLPEVEATRTAEADTAPTAAAAPTTMGWGDASVPVQPAPDFAVVTDPASLPGFSAPARPAAANGNGHVPAPAPSAEPAPASPAAAPATWPSGAAAEPEGGWDAAMFGHNAELAEDDAPEGGDILLVEDDPTVAKLYRMLLENRGYTVRHAVDGLDGLDNANQRRPDLVLLDIMMPRMNGIAFLQALRSGPMKDVPVVVLSNFMEKQLVDDAMSLGALEYMVKAQTRPEALVGALPHWLRGERAFSF